MNVVVPKGYRSVEFRKMVICDYTYDVQLTGGINYDGIPISELPENVRIIKESLGNGALPGQLNDILHEKDDPQLPQAHLNYLVFDDKM